MNRLFLFLKEADIGSLVYIICSDTARVGKTLLARVFAATMALRHDNNPLIFDTDLSGNGIINYLPDKTSLIDLSKVADQVAMFDTMIEANQNQDSGVVSCPPTIPAQDFVIDLAASELRRFFAIFNDIGFERGSVEAGLEVRIYYLVSWTLKSLQTCDKIASKLTASRFFAVRNMAIDAFAFTPDPLERSEVPEINISLFLNKLSPAAFAIVNEHWFSFSTFVSGGYKGLERNVRREIWKFLEDIYNQTNAGVL
ncbi:hypothetical protein MNBD_ALPHA12-477 [hydrothermal vent metagenome]|uniref:CobQ/CobB/MinD/ParA nucleotide binding domain-containing protein n=1 Tax=hydrothermal vent metagenome TaxID=652676 RepID=A0A3B0U0S3_9ZZZZ